MPNTFSFSDRIHHRIQQFKQTHSNDLIMIADLLCHSITFNVCYILCAGQPKIYQLRERENGARCEMLVCPNGFCMENRRNAHYDDNKTKNCYFFVHICGCAACVYCVAHSNWSMGNQALNGRKQCCNETSRKLQIVVTLLNNSILDVNAKEFI